MGCGGSTTLERKGPQKLIVYGDHLNSETRTILAMIKIAGIMDFQFEKVDTLKGEHKE